MPIYGNNHCSIGNEKSAALGTVISLLNKIEQEAREESDKAIEKNADEINGLKIAIKDLEKNHKVILEGTPERKKLSVNSLNLELD